MNELEEKYDNEAYSRVVTMVLPFDADIQLLMDFVKQYGAVCQDNLIHKDSLAEETAWNEVCSGTAQAYTKYYQSQANNVLRDPDGNQL
jgi:hypothetical protein